MSRASWVECLQVSGGDHTALASFTSEDSLLKGGDYQPFIPFGLTSATDLWRIYRFEAEGVLGSTGTPTYQLTLRLKTTAGSATVDGTVVGITAAMTTQSGVSTKQWYLRFDMQLATTGTGANQMTLSTSGFVHSPGGLASPFCYEIQPTTPSSDTWTVASFDGSSTYWLNLDATCSASSASNSIKCKRWMLSQLN